MSRAQLAGAGHWFKMLLYFMALALPLYYASTINLPDLNLVLFTVPGDYLELVMYLLIFTFSVTVILLLGRKLKVGWRSGGY